MRPQTSDAVTYINQIRNAEKKDYALRYAIWLERSSEDRETVVEPLPFHLSYMAAQAVRMRLHKILEHNPSNQGQSPDVEPLVG